MEYNFKTEIIQLQNPFFAGIFIFIANQVLRNGTVGCIFNSEMLLEVPFVLVVQQTKRR